MSLEITLLLAALLIAAACIAARIVKNLLRERKRNVELAAKWKADAPLREAAKEEKQRQQLRYFINGQIKEFRALPSLLQQIQQRVQNAKNEFDQRAFSPFWDEVIAALQLAGKFNSTIELMSRECGKTSDNNWSLVSDTYEVYSLERQTTIPAPYNFIPQRPYYPVLAMADQVAGYNASEVPDPAPILHELNILIRKGQTDFQFATIYEQKKMQAILVQGFSSVTDAVQNMSIKMETSFENLTGVVQQGFQSVSANLQSMQSAQAAGNAAVVSRLNSINANLRLLHYT